MTADPRETPTPEEEAELEASEAEEAEVPEEVAAANPDEDPKVLKDRLMRAMAETENTKRRADKEKQEMVKYAISGFARDLLQVADNLERALASLPQADDGAETTAQMSPENLKNFVTGVEMTGKELLRALEVHGVKRIKAEGQPFDYNLHQAMAEVESPDHAPGTVVQEMQPGYVLHDRLLRPAMVTVAKSDGSGSSPGPDDIEGVDTTA